MKYLNNLFLTYKANIKKVKKIDKNIRINISLLAIILSIFLLLPVILVIINLFIFNHLITFLSYLVLIVILILVFLIFFIKYYILKVKYQVEDFNFKLILGLKSIIFMMPISIIGIIIIFLIGAYI